MKVGGMNENNSYSSFSDCKEFCIYLQTILSNFIIKKYAFARMFMITNVNLNDRRVWIVSCEYSWIQNTYTFIGMTMMCAGLTINKWSGGHCEGKKSRFGLRNDKE